MITMQPCYLGMLEITSSELYKNTVLMLRTIHSDCLRYLLLSVEYVSVLTLHNDDGKNEAEGP